MQVQLQTDKQFCENWGITLMVFEELLAEGLPHFNIKGAITIQTDTAYQWMTRFYTEGVEVAKATPQKLELFPTGKVTPAFPEPGEPDA